MITEIMVFPSRNCKAVESNCRAVSGQGVDYYDPFEPLALNRGESSRSKPQSRVSFFWPHWSRPLTLSVPVVPVGGSEVRGPCR